MNTDLGTIATLVGACSAVVMAFWQIRRWIRADRADRKEQADQAVQKRIDAAIAAERERQALADARDEIENLRKHQRD